MVSKLFAARLANEGIGVYEIQPGFIETDMTAPSKAKYDALIAEGLTHQALRHAGGSGAHRRDPGERPFALYGGPDHPGRWRPSLGEILAMKIKLPAANGEMASYKLQGEPIAVRKPKAPFNRIAFAAAHVVADPFSAADPSGQPASTGRRRSPTAAISSISASASPRPWTPRSAAWAWTGHAPELIGRSLKDAGKRAPVVYSGCGTDHLDPADARSLDDVAAAYLEQLHAIQKLGGRVILMASRALARVAASPDDYVKVYARVLAEADHPVILHWLGEMFDPALKRLLGRRRVCRDDGNGAGRDRSEPGQSRRHQDFAARR